MEPGGVNFQVDIKFILGLQVPIIISCFYKKISDAKSFVLRSYQVKFFS